MLVSFNVELLADAAAWKRLAGRWDELARQVPFRSFAWLSTWWEHYGPGETGQEWPRLCILAVRNEAGAVIGFAPWFLSHSLSGGRVLSMLGTGEVFSDYLSILTGPEDEQRVADALADWLCGPGEKLWDIIELTGIDFEDRVTNRLVDALERRLLTVYRKMGLATWRLTLPGSWEEYLGRLSKSHRKHIRRLERSAAVDGEVTCHQVERADQLPRTFELFADLHQRRWHSRSKPGCFGSPRFAGFLTDVTPRLFAAGQLRLLWIEQRGRPLAVDYMLVGGDVLYSYQGGVEPERLDLQPGRLALIAALRGAIDQGVRCYDFLRGSEPYKAHFRAEPRPTAAFRIVSQRTTAQLRNQAWQAGQQAKLWLKRNLPGLSTSLGAAGSAQPH